MVISLKINDFFSEIGNRGSKLDILSVKEQRVDGSSVLFLYCKMYSNRRETGSIVELCVSTLGLSGNYTT